MLSRNSRLALLLFQVLSFMKESAYATAVLAQGAEKLASAASSETMSHTIGIDLTASAQLRKRSRVTPVLWGLEFDVAWGTVTGELSSVFEAAGESATNFDNLVLDAAKKAVEKESKFVHPREQDKYEPVIQLISHIQKLSHQGKLSPEQTRELQQSMDQIARFFDDHESLKESAGQIIYAETKRDPLVPAVVT